MGLLLGPYFRLAVYAVLVVIGFGIGWKVNGWRHDAADLAQMEADQAAIQVAAEQARKVAELRQARTDIAAQLEIERDRKAETVVKEVIRDVIRYVQTPAASDCGIDSVGVCIINASAGLPCLPEAAGTPDATAGTVVASVTDNYATCTRNSNQLSALQDWARAQQ